MLNKKGFTLVELVVTIAILGILAGIAIPYFTEGTDEAAAQACYANRRQIEKAHLHASINDKVDLDTFLKNITDDQTYSDKFFKSPPQCSRKGNYKTYKEWVVCDYPTHAVDDKIESTLAESIIDNFNAMMESFFTNGTFDKTALDALLQGNVNAAQWMLNNNDKMREAYLSKYGDWPQGTGVNNEAIEFMFHLDKEGSLVVYAHEVSLSGQQWKTNYIYDSANKVWYYSETSTNLAGISDKDKGKTEAEVIQGIIEAGWNQIEINDNQFQK